MWLRHGQPKPRALATKLVIFRGRVAFLTGVKLGKSSDLFLPHNHHTLFRLVLPTLSDLGQLMSVLLRSSASYLSP